MVGTHLDAEYDVHMLKQLEATHTRASTPFARELKKLLAMRGGEPVMRSAWRLPSLLELISEDAEQPNGAWVYVTISRGVELIADGVTVQETHLPNYDSAERDHRENVDTDVRRQLELRFVDTWVNVAKECGLRGKQPTVILPLGAVMRKGKVRIVFDPSRVLEGTSEGAVSLNDLQIIDGKTCLANIQLLLAAMSETGSFWKADLASAFSQIPLAAKSVTYCGFMWQGPNDAEPTVYSFRRLGFGFKLGCYVQQCVAIMLSRALVRRLTRLGLKCGKAPLYNEPQPKNYPVQRLGEKRDRRAAKMSNKRKPSWAKKGDPEFTAILSYLDDFGGVCDEGTLDGDLLVGDFSFLHFLSITKEVGCVVAAQRDKTERATRDQQIYLGFEVICRDLCIKLDENRIEDMVKLLDGVMSSSTITVKELLSLIGILVFAALVIQGARFAYAGLLDKVRSLRHGAPKSFKILVDKIFIDDCEMYKELMARMNGLHAIQGARRPCVKWEFYSDASFLGWCYWTEAGHYEDARWPEPWLRSRIGLPTKYKDIFICELEAWAVLIGLRKCIPLCAFGLLVIWCDNAPVVQMLRRHTSRSSRCAPIIREIEFLLALYNVELKPMHVRTYDNSLADLGTRQFENNAKTKSLEIAKHKMREKAKKLFPTKPRRCAQARPQIFDLYKKYRASMDVWSAPLGDKERAELEMLLPHYLKSVGESALDTSEPHECVHRA